MKDKKSFIQKPVIKFGETDKSSNNYHNKSHDEKMKDIDDYFEIRKEIRKQFGKPKTVDDLNLLMGLDLINSLSFIQKMSEDVNKIITELKKDNKVHMGINPNKMGKVKAQKKTKMTALLKANYQEVVLATKKKLSKLNGDERFDFITKIFKETRDAVIQGEGKCDDDKLIMSYCKDLGLDYSDYKALSVWAMIN